MDSYLLDTNILSYWHDARCRQHAKVVAHIRGVSEAHLHISVVSLGEIEYGESRPRRRSPVDEQSGREYLAFVHEQFPFPLDIRRSTASIYGEVRGLLFGKYAGRKRSLRPEQLVDPDTALMLGVQENDIWIVSQALEHNLVLVTGDKMTHLMGVVGPRLRVENWTAD